MIFSTLKGCDIFWPHSWAKLLGEKLVGMANKHPHPRLIRLSKTHSKTRQDRTNIIKGVSLKFWATTHKMRAG